MTMRKNDPIGDPAGTIIADSLFANWDEVRPTSKCPYCKGSGKASSDGETECGFCEADDIDWQAMPWQDLLQEIWDRVYEGPPEELRQEVSRRFAAQDARGKQHMLRDVGSSLWHIYDMTDREDDCGT